MSWHAIRTGADSHWVKVRCVWDEAHMAGLWAFSLHGSSQRRCLVLSRGRLRVQSQGAAHAQCRLSLIDIGEQAGCATRRRRTTRRCHISPPSDPPRFPTPLCSTLHHKGLVPSFSPDFPSLAAAWEATSNHTGVQCSIRCGQHASGQQAVVNKQVVNKQ